VNVKRVPGAERRYGFVRRSKALEGRNPMSDTGMKQGRTDRKGVSRQEGEKS